MDSLDTHPAAQQLDQAKIYKLTFEFSHYNSAVVNLPYAYPSPERGGVLPSNHQGNTAVHIQKCHQAAVSTAAPQQ